VAATPRIKDEDLEAMLALSSGADSVELKLTVPDDHLRSAVGALGMDPLDAQIRQVFFFDTPDLELDGRGLVVRARRIQGKGTDSVVKLRPVVPADVPQELRVMDDFGVEVDAMPGGFVSSARLRRVRKRDEVRAAIAGEVPLASLFSKSQRRLFAQHAGEIGFDDLAVLGPIFVLKLKFSPSGYDRKLVAELWLYPDDSRILELSTKCEPDEAFQVAAEARAFLTERGIDLSGEQQTKTRKALEFFAERLKAA
jgi:hypothetical protein